MGAWVAQSVKSPTSTQAMISWFMGSGPALGGASVLTAQSLEPALDSVSLSAPPLLMLCLYLSRINKHFKKLLEDILVRGATGLHTLMLQIFP